MTAADEHSALLAASGSYLQMEHWPFADETWQDTDWILLPYVHPSDSSARTRVVQDLTTAWILGKRCSESRMFMAWRVSLSL